MICIRDLRFDIHQNYHVTVEIQKKHKLFIAVP